MINMGIHLDLGAANNAAKALAATDKQLKQSISGALRDTGKDATKLLKKDLSKTTRIAQKRLAVRIKMRRYQEDGSVVLWVGTNPIPHHTVGPVKWNSRSVVAGRIIRRGAFLAHIGRTTRGDSHGLRTFIRVAGNHYNPDDYGPIFGDSGYGGKVSRWGSLKHRFPVALGVVRIEEETAEAIARLEPEIQELFENNFRRRLNDQVSAQGQ